MQKCYEHKLYKNGLKFAKQILSNGHYADHAGKGRIRNELVGRHCCKVNGCNCSKSVNFTICRDPGHEGAHFECPRTTGRSLRVC